MDRKKIKRKIHRRIRKKIKGNLERPRLAVNFSNLHVYAQIIDDIKGHTIVSASTIAEKNKIKGSKVQKAKEIGKILAKKAKDAKIKQIVFDRGGIKYHGKVAALADSVREAGIIF